MITKTARKEVWDEVLRLSGKTFIVIEFLQVVIQFLIKNVNYYCSDNRFDSIIADTPAWPKEN